jgi:hypothetical protein
MRLAVEDKTVLQSVKVLACEEPIYGVTVSQDLRYAGGRFEMRNPCSF